MTSILKSYFLNVKTVDCNYSKYIVIFGKLISSVLYFRSYENMTVDTCTYGIITVNKSRGTKNNYLSQNIPEIFIKWIM